MGKTLKGLFWTCLFLLLLLGIDQFFMQVPPLHPAHQAVSRFYQDFRSRLLTLVLGESTLGKRKPTIPHQPMATSIEAVINHQSKAVEPTQPTATPQTSQRYVYSDADGQLQFAESLEEVPLQYRATAEPMSR